MTWLEYVLSDFWRFVGFMLIIGLAGQVLVKSILAIRGKGDGDISILD